MRPTRRSRSAATPQKDEPANQVEEVQVIDKNVKINLETVLEKEGDNQEEAGAVCEEPNSNDTDVVNATNASAEASTPELKSDSSPQKPAPSAGAIELNCQVCNCSFTNYHEHMNSEAHKALINHSNPKTEVPNNTEVASSSPKPNPANQAVKRAGEQSGAPSPKRMKNQPNASSNPNASSEVFRCDTCNLTILRKPDFDHHMSGKKHLIAVNKAQGKSYCEICKLFFNNVADYTDHTESQLHKKNFTDRKVAKRSFECKVCNTSSLGEQQFEQHLLSKRHKRAVALTAKTTTNSVVKTESSNAVNGSIVPKVQENQKKWLYVCNACNFSCNVDQQFSSHMILAAHKAAVTDMKKKGLMKANDAAQSQTAKTAPNVPAASAVRTVPSTGGAGNQPNAFKGHGKPGISGPNTSVARNPPAVGRNLPAGGRNPPAVGRNPPAGVGAATSVPAIGKSGQFKKDVPQGNRKVPGDGPKKNLMANKPNPAGIPPLGGTGNRGNMPFQQGMVERREPPMNYGMQKLVFEPVGNFGPSQNASGNYGQFRPSANFGNGNLSMNLGPAGREEFRGDVRADFRGNIRDEYRADIRDIRNVDMGGDNRVAGFRTSIWRGAPVDGGRDAQGDFRGNFRSDMPVDVRPDMRSGVGADARGDMRALARNDLRSEVGNDLRSFSNNDIRDMRSDSRSDFIRERNNMSNYLGSSAFASNYRGNADDYRQDSYGRVGQGSGMSTNNFSSSGPASSGRFVDNFMDRSSAGYDNQYSGSSRGIAFMGNMSLNGR